MTATVSVEANAAEAAARFEAHWRALDARCLEPTVFNAPAFMIPALQHLPEARYAALVMAWSGQPGASQLLGLGVIDRRARYRSPFPAAALLHQQATAAFPLLDRDMAGIAMRALLEGVSTLPGQPAGLLLHGLASEGPTLGLLRDRSYRVLDSRTRAVLPAGTALSMAGKERKELRRLWHRLGEQGRLGFVAARGPGDVQDAFHRFLQLEAKGWKGRHATALGSRPDLRRFAESAVLALAEEGSCRVLEVQVDDVTIASGVLLRSHDRGFFWKTAFDEAYRRFSPGVQLTMRLGEHVMADSTITLTDSCAVPGHSMIDRLWPDRIELNDLCIALQSDRSFAFDLTVRAEQARRRLRRRLKSLRAALRLRRS